jgi:hypothetical protein
MRPAQRSPVALIEARADDEDVPPRRPGQHARERARRHARRAIAALLVLVALGIALVLAAGFNPAIAIVAEVAVLAGVMSINRRSVPRVERWARGAGGEERVGAIVDALHARGWRAIHDVDTGRGNIDHVLVGPGGVLTVETKSHRGRLAVEYLDERMFKQAYAQAKHLERITGQRVAPLLVFSDAYLDRPVSRRRGVVVLPARMLAGHLDRRPAHFSPAQVEDLHRRLAAALG